MSLQPPPNSLGARSPSFVDVRTARRSGQYLAGYVLGIEFQLVSVVPALPVLVKWTDHDLKIDVGHLFASRRSQSLRARPLSPKVISKNQVQ